MKVQPSWLCLDAAEKVTKGAMNGIFQEFFSGYFVIGSNGAGEAIAFDCCTDGDMKIVYFDMTNIELDESVQPLASSFDELLELVEDA